MLSERVLTFCLRLLSPCRFLSRGRLFSTASGPERLGDPFHLVDDPSDCFQSATSAFTASGETFEGFSSLAVAEGFTDSAEEAAAPFVTAA